MITRETSPTISSVDYLASLYLNSYLYLPTYPPPTLLLFVVIFETTSYLSEADLQLLIILLQPPELVSANKSQEPTQK